MEAKERLYETVDGDIVREGDPRGAFLKFAVGDSIGTDYEGRVNKLTKDHGTESAAYHDDDVRSALRVAQADPTRANQAVAAAAVHDDPNAPVFYHDRLATELADEARALANRGLSLVDGQTAAAERLFYTEDRDRLVKEGDADGRYLAYAPGDVIRKEDLDSFEAATDEDDDEDDDDYGQPVSPAAPVTPAPSGAPSTTPPAKKVQPAKAAPVK